MPKVPELPPDVARAVIKNMRAKHAERDPVKRETIAVLQLRALQDHWNGKLRLNDVKQLFEHMAAEMSTEPSRTSSVSCSTMRRGSLVSICVLLDGKGRPGDHADGSVQRQ
ncbi:hypothetical protein [Bradyrhizobium sp. SZCCHNS3004]|uniref:hypothetical protein n=1 Tax=Bradyrhizobium sp. SZCCHNS3004 TaxID=3057312 RepID=UPI002916B142|nr:hypothetical protein [Bradyrhizobium sp. SZCCHNS3004]